MLYARDVLLKGLEQKYILESGSEVRTYLRLHPGAVCLLAEAAAHIDNAFGAERLKAIRLMQDESEGTTVFGIIFWPESLEKGKNALALFDQCWWLQNCHRADGYVNFDIELM